MVQRAKRRLVAVRKDTEQHWRLEARNNSIKSSQQDRAGAEGLGRASVNESTGLSDQVNENQEEN